MAKLVALKKISRKLQKGTVFEPKNDRDARAFVKMKLARLATDDEAAGGASLDPPAAAPVAPAAVDPEPAAPEPSATEELDAALAESGPLTRLTRRGRRSKG